MGSTVTYTGILGTSVVTVTVTPPSSDSCLTFGFVYTNSSNGFRIDTDCTAPYNTDHMWGFDNISPDLKTVVLMTNIPDSTCPNIIIPQPTLTLTISGTSNYRWYNDGTKLYASLSMGDTLIFTISETATDTGTTQVNTTFTGCSDTSLHTCSNLNFSYYTHPNLVQPALTIVGNVLTAYHPFTTSFQWYRNNTQIPGATSNTYTMIQSGDYYVEAILPSGCPSTSGNVISFVGIQDYYNTESISIYPNPSTSVFHFDAGFSSGAKARFFIFDSIGKQISKNEVTSIGGILQSDIDLSGKDAGVYILQFEIGQARLIKKLIKLKE